MTSFNQRLEDILRIRSQVDEFTRFLGSQRFDFRPFFMELDAAKPLLYNESTAACWERVVKQFDKSLEPLESEVLEDLRKKLAPLLDRPQLLLSEFQNCSIFLQRPKIRQGLLSESETLLSLLRDMMKKLEQIVDKLEDNDIGDEDSVASIIQRSQLVSPRVANIIYLRQIRSKVATMASTSKLVLKSLHGYDKLSSAFKSLHAKIKSEEESRYKEWKSDMKRKIEDTNSSLQFQGTLLDWKNGLLIVNFSEDLVKLIREARHLDELGLLDASKGSTKKKIGIVEKAIEAEKFYRFGILLKKTANSYNSLSEQMKDVQEQLLLKSLGNFVEVVTPSNNNLTGGRLGVSDISWSNPSACEAYVMNVQKAAEQLSNENRRLRKVHESLSHSTVLLMNIELL